MKYKYRRRILVEGKSAVYHVISRTACQAFLLGSREKEVFCQQLRKQAAFTGVEVLSYCIMSNHFHLLLRVPFIDSLPDVELLRRYREYYGEDANPISTYTVAELEKILAEGGIQAETARKRILNRIGHLPSFMRELKQRFSIWYNHEHGTAGTVWSARYKSLMVEDAPEVLTKVAAYIDLNPVRAEIVDDPKDYRWCAYAASLAGHAVARSGIEGLFCGKRSFKEAIASYRLILFGKGYSVKGSPAKDGGRISADRLAEVVKKKGAVPMKELFRVRVRYFRDGLALGSKEFIGAVLEDYRDAFGPKRTRAGCPLTEMEGSNALYSFRNLKSDIYG